MKEIVVRHKTPHGGDYSKLVYMNEKMEVVDRLEATMCAILEFKDDGTQVYETFGEVEITD